MGFVIYLLCIMFNIRSRSFVWLSFSCHHTVAFSSLQTRPYNSHVKGSIASSRLFAQLFFCGPIMTCQLTFQSQSHANFGFEPEICLLPRLILTKYKLMLLDLLFINKIYDKNYIFTLSIDVGILNIRLTF